MSFFDENIEQLQKAFYKSGFIKLLETSTHQITETQNKDKIGASQRLTVMDIPLPAWRLNLEIEGMFKLARKKPEEALFFYTDQFFVIIFIELKSQLNRSNIKSLKSKFKEALEEILLLLPIYEYGQAYSELKPLFIGLTAYKGTKKGTLESLQSDRTNKNESISTFLKGIQQDRSSMPLKGGIEIPFLGRHRIYYTFYQEDQEELQYSIKQLLDALSVDIDNMSTCPNSK